MKDIEDCNKEDDNEDIKILCLEIKDKNNFKND